MSNLRHLLRGISQLDVKPKNPDSELSKYDKYIARLRAPISLAESVTTASKLVAWISTYQLGNPAEPWLVARRLVRKDMPINARVAGLQLFEACVNSRPDLPAVVRLMFFNDVQKEFAKEDFDHQIIALTALTKDARDISSFDSQICTCVALWIDRALSNLDTRKYLVRRAVSLSTASRHEDLRSVIFYMTNLVKFHFSILEESGITLMVDKVVLVCKRTGEEEDIRQALIFFDAIIRYGYIPLDSLSEVINVVCSVYQGLASQQTMALSVMQNLLRSHMSQATLKSLKTIIQGIRNVHDDVILGALAILTSRWTSATEEHKEYTFTVESLFECYRQGLSSTQPRPDRNQMALDTAYLKSVLLIISVDHIARTLSFDDWEAPLDVMKVACRSIDRASRTRFSENTDTKIDVQEDIHLVFEKLVCKLEELANDEEVSLPISYLVKLWAALSQHLPLSTTKQLFRYYADELACYPSDPCWLENIEAVIKMLFLDLTQPQEIRAMVLQHIGEIMGLVASTEADLSLHPLLLDLLRPIEHEPDADICKDAIALIVHISQEGSRINSLAAVSFLRRLMNNTLLDATEEKNEAEKRGLSDFSSSSTFAIRSPSLRGIPRPASLSLTPSRISSPTQSREQLHKDDPPLTKLSRAATDGLVSTFLYKFTQASSELVLDLFRSLIDACTSANVHKDSRLQVLACLGRIRADSQHSLYLDLEETQEHQHAAEKESLYISQDRYAGIRSPYTSKLSSTGKTCLPINEYMAGLCKIIYEEQDWQICMAAIGIAKQQLTNRQLFSDCGEQLQDLRTVLCDHLMNARRPTPVLSYEIKREDVIIYFVKLLSLVIGYHHLFSKQQEDEIVAVLQNTLMKYQKATPACVHTLLICAYEIPLSTAKNLASILTRLSQLVTSTNASVHILEFLSALAKLPDLYVNFREDDYRRIFGVALQHIQYANATARDAIAADSEDPLRQPMAAYVLTLAFDALYAWFLALKLSQRPRYLKWIVDGLLAANPQSKTLDERCLVCYDFLARFCYSNVEIRSVGDVLKKFEAESSTAKSWIHGNSILTLRTMNLSGLTEITTRRPSGTTSFLCKPNSDLEALSIISSSEAKALLSNGSTVGPIEQKLRNVISGVDSTAFTPSHLLLQIAVSPELSSNEKPLLLNEDDVTRRALATLDRIPVVDFHKIGIIYVGRGQTEQKEILSNTYGSPEYVTFLEQLGDLIRLKENDAIYTGGLDKVMDEDGEFAYAHCGKITQIIFHTCTLMPTRPDTDPGCNRKKSHIGNDFVNIIWNSSNRPYDPTTIPSEFNFVNIVVSPDAYQISRATSADHDNGTASEPFYKVKVLPNKELPSISPITEWQLISASQVSNFVRTVALHCDTYAQIHHAQGGYTTMWRQRLERIITLRQRTQGRANDVGVGTARQQGTEEEDKAHGYNFTAYN